jgi:hypothetical protein
VPAICRRFLVLISLLTGSAANAQIAPEQVPFGRTVPLREVVRLEMESSWMRVGPLRLQPLFAIENFGYDSNVFASDGGEVADWTAGVRAGARGIIRMGRKMFLRGDATGSYTWYADLEDNRRTGWNAGGSLLGLYNRASFDASARTTRSLDPLSSEIEVPVERTLNSTSIAGELAVIRRLSIFAGGEIRSHDHEQAAFTEDVAALDRTEQAVRLGARYRLGRFLTVSAFAADLESDFERGDDRDDKGSLVAGGAQVDRGRLFVNATVGRRSIERESDALDFSTTTGSGFASFYPRPRLGFEIYGNRSLIYGVLAESPVFVEKRIGVGGVMGFRERVLLRLFGEQGNNDYPLPVQGLRREDDATSVGGSVTVRVFRTSRIIVQASRSDYDSNLPNFDRSAFRIVSTFAIEGDFFQ